MREAFPHMTEECLNCKAKKEIENMAYRLTQEPESLSERDYYFCDRPCMTDYLFKRYNY